MCATSINNTKVSSRLLWVKVKFGKDMWVFVFVFAHDAGIERDETERKTFLNDLDDCLQSFGVNVGIVLLEDLNDRVMCRERIGGWFIKKDIHKYT